MRWLEILEADNTVPSAFQKFTLDQAAKKVTALIQSQMPADQHQQLIDAMSERLNHPKMFSRSLDEIVGILCEYLELKNIAEPVKTKPKAPKKSNTPLQDALEDFSNGYNKEDAFGISSERAKLENQIITLYSQSPKPLPGTIVLYRGTAISDKDYASLIAGHTVSFQLKPSGKLVSWSTKRSVAKTFASDSWNNGESNSVIIIQQTVDDFDLTIPVFKFIKNNGEHEVLTNNCVISVGPHNMVWHRAYKGN